MLLSAAVAQEFGLSQADSAVSSSHQPQQASSTVHILSLLLRLRQCCCHLSLLKKVSTCAVVNLDPCTEMHTNAKFALLCFCSSCRLLTPLSLTAMGLSCLWRSNSVLYPSLVARRSLVPTPKIWCP